MSIHIFRTSIPTVRNENVNHFAVDMQKPENLADFVRRVRNEKGLSLNDIQRQSSNEIANSYVSRIENGIVTNVTPQKLRALAKGLGVSDEEIFAVVRGKPLGEPQSPAEFGVLFYGWDEATDEQKAETLAAIKMIAESFQRRRERNPQKPRGNNGSGKKKK